MRILCSLTGFGIEEARLRWLARLRFAGVKASADTLGPCSRIPPSVDRVRSDIPDGDECGVRGGECGDEYYVDPQELLRFLQAGDEGQDDHQREAKEREGKGLRVVSDKSGDEPPLATAAGFF